MTKPVKKYDLSDNYFIFFGKVLQLIPIKFWSSPEKMYSIKRLFVPLRKQEATCNLNRVSPLPVIKGLYVVKELTFGLGPRLIPLKTGMLCLKGVEKTLHHGVIPAVTLAAHRLDTSLSLQLVTHLTTCDASVRVKDKAFIGPTPLYGLS